ncbi:hypothetical protein RF55_10212 [Lasius niger]|uniref:Uncharacterized protein n=1 Tax=Lasius niger TaxID=67767 RepID=A0A0J7KIP5_LASNI|nr:hypothetical protein RF55_10212 [Lasius niger]
MMELDNDLPHNAASNDSSLLKALSESASKDFVDNPRLDVVKVKNSKRKIVEKESSPVSKVAGGESGEGDVPKAEKRYCGAQKIGFSKINVQLKSRDAANNLIASSILKAKKYKVFIPFYRTTRRGIIRNVPLDLSEEDIRRGIDSEAVVLSIKRLNRRKRNSDSLPTEVADGDSGLTLSKTILVTFKGQTLPRGSHKTTSTSCPEYIFQKKIRELAAHENITLVEAVFVVTQFI